MTNRRDRIALGNLSLVITTVRLNVVQYEMVTTTLFAIMAVIREEARKIGLFSNELMPEMCRFSVPFCVYPEREPFACAVFFKRPIGAELKSLTARTRRKSFRFRALSDTAECLTGQQRFIIWHFRATSLP